MRIIQKQKKLSEYPYQYKPHMYALQEKYINELFHEKKYVNKQVVNDYVNSLPPQRLMYAVNYIYKQTKLNFPININDTVCHYVKYNVTNIDYLKIII